MRVRSNVLSATCRRARLWFRSTIPVRRNDNRRGKFWSGHARSLLLQEIRLRMWSDEPGIGLPIGAGLTKPRVLQAMQPAPW